MPTVSNNKELIKKAWLSEMMLWLMSAVMILAIPFGNFLETCLRLMPLFFNLVSFVVVFNSLVNVPMTIYIPLNGL